MRKRSGRKNNGEPNDQTAPLIRYRLIVRNTVTNVDSVADETLPESLWQTLLTFRDEVQLLRRCAWVQANLRGSYTLHYEGVKTWVDQRDPPSDTEVRETLHVLRPFLLQSEALYYPRVSGKLLAEIKHESLRKRMAHERLRFSGKRMRRLIQVTRNQLELNTEHAFDLWMGAFEYHRHGKDPKPRETFLGLHGGPPDEFAILVFRDMLRERILAILGLANFVHNIEQSPTYRRFRATEAKAS